MLIAFGVSGISLDLKGKTIKYGKNLFGKEIFVTSSLFI
jgi:hypothetical protein